jgi:hypothetical protein
MAQVYKRVNGMKLEKAMALQVDVQLELGLAANAMAGRASAELARHRDQGHSYIEVETGNVDRYVTLNDERGLKAALSIEYGKAPGYSELEDGSVAADGGSPGLFILHRAAGIKVK